MRGSWFSCSRRSVKFNWLRQKLGVDRLFIIRNPTTSDSRVLSSLSFNSFDISEDDGTKTIGKDQKRRANCSGRNIKNKNPKKSWYIYFSAWSCDGRKDKARGCICVEWPKFLSLEYQKVYTWPVEEKGWGGRWRVSIFFFSSSPVCFSPIARYMYFILREKK
jgi:hypothetical protein